MVVAGGLPGVGEVSVPRRAGVDNVRVQEHRVVGLAYERLDAAVEGERKKH